MRTHVMVLLAAGLAVPRVAAAQDNSLDGRWVVRGIPVSYHVQGTTVDILVYPAEAQLARYRAAPGNKAVAYCIDWNKVSATAVPQGPFAMNTGPDPDAAVQARTLAACTQRAVPSCTCTLVDADGRNVLRVPAAVVERLNKTP